MSEPIDSLSAALAAAEAVRLNYQARCLAVWALLATEYPRVAAVIRSSCRDDAEAAWWACWPGGGEGPAAWLAAGRSEADVLAEIERAKAGFVG